MSLLNFHQYLSFSICENGQTEKYIVIWATGFTLLIQTYSDSFSLVFWDPQLLKQIINGLETSLAEPFPITVCKLCTTCDFKSATLLAPV